MSFQIADEMWRTESAIISSYPTGVEWNSCFIKYQTLDQYLELYFLPTRVFGHFVEKFSVSKNVSSIFGQATAYKIYTLSREPIRLPEIQYPVFGI